MTNWWTLGLMNYHLSVGKETIGALQGICGLIPAHRHDRRQTKPAWPSDYIQISIIINVVLLSMTECLIEGPIKLGQS